MMKTFLGRLSLEKVSMEKAPRGLRVALVLTELRAGGMERVVVHLSRGLVGRGIPTLIVCLQEPGALAGEFGPEDGIRLEALHSTTGKDIWAVTRLTRMLQRFQASVINVHDYASAPYAVLAGRFALRKPVLFTAHGLLFEGFERLQRRYRFFSHFFSGITAVSEEVAERHREYLRWRGPMRLVRNGVPEVKQSGVLGEAVRKELGIAPSNWLFLAVGNARPEKALEELIDATALLGNGPEGGKIVTAVAGQLDGSPYCNMLLRRVEEKGVGKRFHFLGFRPDTAALYSAADAFVLCSRSEGLPMVILEAMMAGLPVIATRVGGVPDALGDRGLLVEPGKPEQLAHAMERMVLEDRLAHRLGRAGKAHASSQFGVGRMVEAYIACYRSLVEKRSVS